jgi:hypothetical protein
MLERLPGDVVFLVASRYLSLPDALRLRCCCARLLAAIPVDKLCRCHPAVAPAYGTTWDMYEDVRGGLFGNYGLKRILLNWKAGVALVTHVYSDGCGQCNWTDECEMSARIVATPESDAFVLELIACKETKRIGGNSFGSAKRYALGSARGVRGVFHDRWTHSERRVDGQHVLRIRVRGDALLVAPTEHSNPVFVRDEKKLSRVGQRCREPLAIVPAGIAPLRTAWMAIALYLKHVFGASVTIF